MGGVGDAADIDGRAHRGGARTRYGTGQGVDLRTVAGAHRDVGRIHAATDEVGTGVVADRAPGHRTLHGDIARGTGGDGTGQDLGLVLRIQRHVAAGGQLCATRGCLGLAGDLVDGQRRAHRNLGTHGDGTRQRGDVGRITGIQGDRLAVQRSRGGKPCRIYPDQRCGGVVDLVVGRTAHAGELAGTHTQPGADCEDVGMIFGSDCDIAAAGAARPADVGAGNRHHMAVVDAVVAERHAGIAVADLCHAGHGDDRAARLVALYRADLGIAAGPGIRIGIRGDRTHSRAAIVHAHGGRAAIVGGTYIDNARGAGIYIQRTRERDIRAAIDCRRGLVGDLVDHHRAGQADAVGFLRYTTGCGCGDDARSVGRDDLHIVGLADAAAADGCGGFVGDVRIGHGNAHTRLAADVQCAAAVTDLRLVDRLHRHVIAARAVAQRRPGQTGGGAVLGHCDRGRYRRSNCRALVAGSVDANSQPHIDLLVLVARGDGHIAGPVQRAADQAGMGVIGDIAVRDTTGNGRTAVAVVRVRLGDRDGPADAYQQGLVDGGDVQLAGGIQTMHGRRGDIGLGVLADAVDGDAARYRHPERGLVDRAGFALRRILAAEQSLGLVEVAGNLVTAKLLQAAGHRLQPGDLVAGACLEAVEEAGILAVLLVSQGLLGFLVFFLLRLAADHGASGGNRAGQAFAGRIHRQRIGGNAARASGRAPLLVPGRYRADESARVGIHLLVGHAGADRQAVGHRHGTGNRPDKQVLIGLHVHAFRGDRGLVAHTRQSMAVQVQRRCGATDADAATLARLQRQRDDGFLVLCRHFQCMAVDHRAVIDQCGGGIVVVHVTDTSPHCGAAVPRRYPLQGQAKITGGVDRGDLGAGPHHRVLVEAARDLLARLVPGIQRGRPWVAIDSRGGDARVAGQAGAGHVLRLEIADHTAQGNRIRRALGRTVRGEQVRGIADELLGVGDGILEFVKAAELRLCRQQGAEVARQADIGTQADVRPLQRSPAVDQRGCLMFEIGNGDRAGQGERRPVVALALALDVAQRVVGDLRVDHLAVHNDVATSVYPGAGSDRGSGSVTATHIADRAAQAKRRRWRAAAAAVAAVAAVTIELLLGRGDALAGEGLHHLHQLVAAGTGILRLVLILVLALLLRRRGDQRGGAVLAGNSGCLHGDIASGIHITGQRGGGIKVLQADRTGKTDLAGGVCIRGRGGVQRCGVDRRDIDAAHRQLVRGLLHHRRGSNVDVADRGSEAGNRVVGRERLRGQLQLGIGIGFDR